MMVFANAHVRVRLILKAQTRTYETAFLVIINTNYFHFHIRLFKRVALLSLIKCLKHYSSMHT